MKVVIAEDEPLARSLLRALLEDSGDIEIVGEARNGSEALMLSERLRPDAVFLDVDMPGGSGISTAHELLNRSPAEIVFVTAHDLHAVDAFELGAADYVLKPVRRLRLAKALDRVRARVRERCETGTAKQNRRQGDRLDPSFWVRARQGMVRVQICDIVWIEAARDHVYFHTADQAYMYRITMDELEGKLVGTGIVRVQRSAFVRLAKVTAIARRGKSLLLELENDIQVPVGRSYQAKTLAALMDMRGQTKSIMRVSDEGECKSFTPPASTRRG